MLKRISISLAIFLGFYLGWYGGGHLKAQFAGTCSLCCRNKGTYTCPEFSCPIYQDTCNTNKGKDATPCGRCSFCFTLWCTLSTRCAGICASDGISSCSCEIGDAPGNTDQFYPLCKGEESRTTLLASLLAW